MIFNSKFAGVFCAVVVLSGCSSGTSTQAPVVSSVAPQNAPGTHGTHPREQPNGNPDHHNVPVLGRCENFSGSYQMNMDSFTLAQEGCVRLTWSYAPQMSFDGSGEPERGADGMPVFSAERKVTWELNGEDRGGERSYFHADGKRLIVEKNDGAKDVYFIASEHICDLHNPEGTYLVKESFAAGDDNLSSRVNCSFWSRH